MISPLMPAVSLMGGALPPEAVVLTPLILTVGAPPLPATSFAFVTSLASLFFVGAATFG